MPVAVKVRSLVLLASAVGCVLFSAPSARAQFKLELQTCEDLKITQKQYGISVVETATCVNPTKFFRPKGTLRNVHIVATFPQVGADGRGRHLPHNQR